MFRNILTTAFVLLLGAIALAWGDSLSGGKYIAMSTERPQGDPHARTDFDVLANGDLKDEDGTIWERKSGWVSDAEGNPREVYRYEKQDGSTDPETVSFNSNDDGTGTYTTSAGDSGGYVRVGP